MPELSNCAHQSSGWCCDCVSELAGQLDLARLLLSHAIEPVLDACGNSYANSHTENWLGLAALFGAYKGDLTGNIVDLRRAWTEQADALPRLQEIKDVSDDTRIARPDCENT